MTYKIEIFQDKIWKELMFNLYKDEAEDYIKEYKFAFGGEKFRIIEKRK